MLLESMKKARLTVLVLYLLRLVLWRMSLSFLDVEVIESERGNFSRSLFKTCCSYVDMLSELIKIGDRSYSRLFVRR